MTPDTGIVNPLRFMAVLSFTMILVLASCAATSVTATPTATPPPLAANLPPLAGTSIEQACASNMDLDLEEAYDRFDDPILWTFHTSFFTENLQQPNTIFGCLRYFWRDENQERYEGEEGEEGEDTLAGAVLVECSVHPSVQIMEAPQMYSSGGERQWPDDFPPDRLMPGRKAIFADNGSIQCPLNIRDGFAEVVQRPNFQEAVEASLENVDDEGAVFTYTVPITSTYPEFTAVAAVAKLAADAGPYPLFSYQPTADNPDGVNPQEYGTHFGMSIASPQYITWFGATEYAVSPLIEDPPVIGGQPPDACIVDFPDHNAYFWLDYGHCRPSFLTGCNDDLARVGEKYLRFGYSHTTTFGPTQYCRNEAQAVPNFVPFYAGSATLMLRYPGELYELWFDPNAAVKGY